MHTSRFLLAALFSSAASASTVTMQLTDLSFSAYSLNPQGGSAAVGVRQDPYHVVANLLGVSEEKHVDTSWHSGNVVASAIGASSRMPNAAYVVGGWNSQSINIFYDILAEASINDPLSQWYLAETKLDTGATLTLTGQSALVVSGHLAGTSNVHGSDAKAVFSALLEGGGSSVAYDRAYGAGEPLSALNDFFTLTLFNRTDDDISISWSLDAGLAASREVPAIPEPAPVSMALAGILALSIPHAAGVLRRQRTRAKYRAALPG